MAQKTIDIGKSLHEARKARGLTQRQAALVIGMSHVHLSNIENGKTSTTVEMLEKVYAAWGVDLYLMAAADIGRREW